MQQRGVNTGGLRLGTVRETDPVKTFECGQCFRWNADENGVYTGVVGDTVASVWVEGGEVYVSGGGEKGLWFDYFDISRDYAAISSGLNSGEYLARCIKYGQGIRILRQEPWEALCSFIISQCNNIPRIKSIIETLCKLFGNKLKFNGRDYYTFPSASVIASLSKEDLEPVRCGYRAPYIIEAAGRVSDGGLDLDALSRLGHDEALKKLMELPGVGLKVANCVVLFGLHNMSGFPVDVWMKKALAEHFPSDFDPRSLGEYAGLAQQYIFYYARSAGRNINEACLHT